uniref:Putative ovule protein n=1 Tax=Solanum chacoense TaxID=4108 RepID=A0A0V0IP74_SOLCH
MKRVRYSIGKSKMCLKFFQVNINKQETEAFKSSNRLTNTKASNMVFSKQQHTFRKRSPYLQWRFPSVWLHSSHRAPHDQPMSADTTIPFWANPLQLNLCETSLFKPFYIFFFFWKEHPHICKETR